MQETYPCGSVRGALGNWHPYRDSKYGSKRCLGRTEADRKITSEPWSSKQGQTRTTKTTLGSGRSSVLRKDLTGPTLLEMSDYARLIGRWPSLSTHVRIG